MSSKSSSRFIFFVSRLCIGCQHFVMRVLPWFLIFAVIVYIPRRALHRPLFCLKAFLLRSYHVMPHFFHEPVASSPSYFLARKASNLSPSKSLSLPSLFSFVAVFKHVQQFGFFLALSSAALYPRDFLLFHQCVEHSAVRRDLCPLSLKLRMIPSVHGAVSSAASRGLLPPGFR